MGNTARWTVRIVLVLAIAILTGVCQSIASTAPIATLPVSPSPITTRTVSPEASTTLAATATLTATITPIPTATDAFFSVEPISSATLDAIATQATAFDAEIRDRFLHNPTCALPCFEGVTPGQTTPDEAVEIWQSNPLFAGGQVDLAYYQSINHGSVNISPFGVEALYSSPDQPIEQIRFKLLDVPLGEVIQAYGEPSHVLAKLKAEMSSIYTTWSFTAIWVSQGLVMDISGALPPPERIDEDTLMWLWGYIPAGWESFQQEFGDELALFMPWAGYADFDTYMHPVTTAKTTPIDEIRSRWLNGIPCEAPCWEGITPGLTTASEALEILRNNPLVAEVEIHSPSGPNELIFVTWWIIDDLGIPQPQKARVAYEKATEIVTEIFIWFPDTPLGEFIQRYGEPTRVLAGHIVFDSEQQVWRLDVLWDSRGVVMRTGDWGRKPIEKVDETTQMITAHYFAPGLAGYAPENPFDELVPQPWQGYAAFAFYAGND